MKGWGFWKLVLQEEDKDQISHLDFPNLQKYEEAENFMRIQMGEAFNLGA